MDLRCFIVSADWVVLMVRGDQDAENLEDNVGRVSQEIEPESRPCIHYTCISHPQQHDTPTAVNLLYFRPNGTKGAQLHILHENFKNIYKWLYFWTSEIRPIDTT
jgi:hypothetical protein